MAHSREAIQEILGPTLTIDGREQWDPHVYDDRAFDELLSRGAIAFGDTYVEGKWDVHDLPEMTARILRAEIGRRFFGRAAIRVLLLNASNLFLNVQDKVRARDVGRGHYDIGHDLYARMLDPTITYSCVYWRDVTDLHEAQENKLDLVCRKIDQAWRAYSRHRMRMGKFRCARSAALRRARDRHHDFARTDAISARTGTRPRRRYPICRLP